jgi:hypothetical protein
MEYRYLKTRGALNEAGPEALARSEPAAWRGRVLPSIPRQVLAILPEAVVREHRVLPIAVRGESVTIAAADADDLALADKLSFLIARKVQLVRFPADEIDRAIDRYHGRTAHESVDSMLQEFHDTDATVYFSPEAADAPHTLAGVVMSAPSAGPGRARQAIYRPAAVSGRGLDRTISVGGSGVLTYVVEDGQRVLVRRPNGSMDVIAGPRRVWRGWNLFRPMVHHVAHPGDYLIVRYRDGRQEHLAGPAEVWFDPRIHQEIQNEEGLQIGAKEAIVVYSNKAGTSSVQRRIVHGPALFVPRPGEWLHTFSWHASKGGSKGVIKVPNGLVFQKLWLMPDQMYHDVADVRTADDAVLTIRLMIFYELLDIETMLDATHDPIGDFVNAASSDVVDFTGRHDFESFKHNTDKLNELETYRQLAGRSSQCGYRINKVVYRGYGAPERLQQMHDQAIEARTRLQLERATEQQAQDLENFKLDSQLARAGKRRIEQTAEVEHDLALASTRQESDLRDREGRLTFALQQRRREADLRRSFQAEEDSARREHLAALRDLGVDLTAYLTQNRADRVIELRGSPDGAHIHLDPAGAKDDSKANG